MKATGSYRLEIDRLEDSIIRHCHRINAATYDLLVVLREFDQRAGFLRSGFDNCADWLHWRCDISLSAAREKVRVAHALLELPAISRSLGKGQLAYSKARALTRVAKMNQVVLSLPMKAGRPEGPMPLLKSQTPILVARIFRMQSRQTRTTSSSLFMSIT